MTTYAFETITAEQALAIGAEDIVTFAGRPAHGVLVAYNIPAAGPASVTITFEGRKVEFGMNILTISERGGLDFTGDSRLLVGGADNDGLMGMGEDDALYGGQGNDTLTGQGGNDLMQGNSGDDRLTGDRGSDVIYGGQGNDTIRTGLGLAGEAGDFAHGNMGDDTIQGGWGGDTLLGGQAQDQIHGNAGDDYISGDLGDDALRGGDGADKLLGGSGADTLMGEAGADTLYGGGGGDVADGGEGDDWVIAVGGIADGNDGADTILSVAPGKAILFGGEGQDRFEFMETGSARHEDADEIRDWGRRETLHFDRANVRPMTQDQYEEISAPNYEAALATANSIIAGGKVAYVAAQVGYGDVVVFAETDGDLTNGADAAVILAGRLLTDIDWTNIV